MCSHWLQRGHHDWFLHPLCSTHHIISFISTNFHVWQAFHIHTSLWATFFLILPKKFQRNVSSNIPNYVLFITAQTRFYKCSIRCASFGRKIRNKRFVKLVNCCDILPFRTCFWTCLRLFPVFRECMYTSFAPLFSFEQRIIFTSSQANLLNNFHWFHPPLLLFAALLIMFLGGYSDSRLQITASLSP